MGGLVSGVRRAFVAARREEKVREIGDKPAALARRRAASAKPYCVDVRPAQLRLPIGAARWNASSIAAGGTLFGPNGEPTHHNAPLGRLLNRSRRRRVWAGCVFTVAFRPGFLLWGVLAGIFAVSVRRLGRQ